MRVDLAPSSEEETPMAVDEQLEEIGHDDNALVNVIEKETWPTSSPQNFIKVLDKIGTPSNQEWAVRAGVIGLFKTG